MGTQVRFYGTSGIGSIRTTRQSGFCAVSPGAPWDDAVIVDLFYDTNGQCYIGSLFYGHLRNRIANNLYRSPFTNLPPIGTVPECCPASCYDGLHVHMGRDGFGQTTPAGCHAPLTGGSSWVYKWTFNEGSCV